MLMMEVAINTCLQIPAERCKSIWVYTFFVLIFCFDTHVYDVPCTDGMRSDLAKQTMLVRPL
jgi:hypothetical protein